MRVLHRLVALAFLALVALTLAMSIHAFYAHMAHLFFGVVVPPLFVINKNSVKEYMTICFPNSNGFSIMKKLAKALSRAAASYVYNKTVEILQYTASYVINKMAIALQHAVDLLKLVSLLGTMVWHNLRYMVVLLSLRGTVGIMRLVLRGIRYSIRVHVMLLEFLAQRA